MGRWLDRIEADNKPSTKPTVQQVSSVLSLSKSPDVIPNRTSNNSCVSFVSARDKLLQHLKRKKLLGHRVEILRILIRRIMTEIKYQRSNDERRFIVNDTTVERMVDYELTYYEYDLEKAIASCRSMAPELTLLCKCGYQPPFCACEGISAPDVITCNSCKNFTPDKVGEGAGIGTCGHYINTRNTWGHATISIRKSTL